MTGQHIKNGYVGFFITPRHERGRGVSDIAVRSTFHGSRAKPSHTARSGIMRFPRSIFAALLLGALAGCIKPTQVSEPPLQVTLPENWTALGDAAARVDTQADPQADPLTDPQTDPSVVSKATADTIQPTSDFIPPWLADFDDPTLHALVKEAVGENFDLNVALARVKAARARAEQEGAQRLPEFTTDFSASRARSGLTGTVSNTFDLGVNVSWEVDLWNRLDNAAKAAVAQVKAQEADYHMARLALAANVANAWFNAIESEQQLLLAEKTIVSFENSLGTIERRYRLGIGSALDVRLARENTATARSQREIRARNRDTAVRSLEILLGRYPSATLDIRQDLPKLQHAVPVGLPSDLLDRRPDIIAANAKLLAIDYRLAAARTNRLPGIRLTASGGAASHELRDLINPGSLAWNLLGNLTQPLWNGGRLSAEVDIAVADRQQAAAEYTAVALRAFREVESDLTAEVLLENQETALQIATQEATAAAVLAMEQYRQGLSEIVTLLSTQRREFEARSSLLSIIKQRLNTRVDLYLALGGGF